MITTFMNSYRKTHVSAIRKWNSISSYLKKIVLGILVLFLTFFISTKILEHYFIFELSNYLTLFGFFCVLLGAFLALTQIRINYNFNKRKAALDFIFKNIEIENTPKMRLFLSSYKLLYVDPNTEGYYDVLNYYNTMSVKEDAKNFRILLLDIFNFYERMSIAILKESFDEDICYDDQGFVMTNFYQKTESFIIELRTQYQEPRLYINFEYMSLRWIKRREQSVRQKLITNQQI